MRSWRLFLKGCFFGCLIFLSSIELFAQDERELNDLIQQIVESYAEDTDDEIDIESLVQNLTSYYQNPINLNKADFTELSELQLLDPPQVDALLNHRKKAGDLLNIYELQSIKYFDLNTIERLLPFVKVSGQIDDLNLSIQQLLSKGKHEIFMRYERTLETRAGFLTGRYLGDPSKIYTRYRYGYGQNLSYGFTLEKDAGEPFGGAHNPLGFDFYSYHLYLKDYGPFKYLALGDYRLNFGQGLLMWSGFSTRKGDLVLGTLKNAYLTKRFTSVTEHEFGRGISATIELNDLSFTAFASRKSLDANIQLLDTLNDDVLEISSIQETGNHRTEGEIEDKHAIKETFAGTNLTFERRNIEIGLSGMFTNFSSPLVRNLETYSKFQFNHNNLLNSSLNYRLLFNNFHFFGEWALSDDLIKNNANKLGLATINGVLVSLDPKIGISLLHRYYNRYYKAYYAKAFGEASEPNNENGLYIGTTIKPNTRWQIDAYADFYTHTWLRDETDAPSQGFDYRTSLTYNPSRKIKVFMRFRNEVKQKNLGENTTATDHLVAHRKTSIRADVTYKITKALRFKTRIERTAYQEGNRPMEEGFLAYQDINLQPLDSPLSFNARFSLFDTHSGDTRVYVYENSPLYVYPNKSFSGTGYRYYANVKFEPTRFLHIWAKFARTKYINTNNLTRFEGISVSDRDQFIDADHVTTVTLQARLKF